MNDYIAYAAMFCFVVLIGMFASCTYKSYESNNKCVLSAQSVEIAELCRGAK